MNEFNIDKSIKTVEPYTTEEMNTLEEFIETMFQWAGTEKGTTNGMILKAAANYLYDLSNLVASDDYEPRDYTKPLPFIYDSATGKWALNADYPEENEDE